MNHSQKRTCSAKTLAQKYEIISFVKDNPSLKQVAICEKFNIKQSTLSTYLQQKQKIIDAYMNVSNSLKIKRFRKPKFEQVDKALLLWFMQKRSSKLWIDGETLRLKGIHFAKAFGFEGAEITSSWIDRWKIRHSINSKVMSGEKSSVDMNIVETWRNCHLRDVLKNWAPADIYNIDETALFWKLTPDKTLSFKKEQVHGCKKPKDRVTVLVGANMSGEKLPLLVIGRFQKPRCFNNVHNLPVEYKANRKAWMTSCIFEEWIRKFDSRLTRQILLVLDNCPAHPNIFGLENIKFLFLPPNTTSCTQPMDCGIIKSLKHIYKRKLGIKMLNAHDENIDFALNLLDSLSLLRESWENVNTDTVINCFRSAGFSANHDVHCNLDQSQNAVIDFCDVYNKLCLSFAIKTEMDYITYVSLDDDVEVSGYLKDDDIIKQLENSDSMPDDEDDEPEVPRISSKEALLAARTLQIYIRQNPNASDIHCEMGQKILSFLESESFSEKKQTKVTDFFK